MTKVIVTNQKALKKIKEPKVKIQEFREYVVE